MPIDGLPPPSALLAALRAEVARKSERTEKEIAAKAPASSQRTRGSAKHDPAALRSELAEIVRGIAPDDEQAIDAARPRIVRAVLLWEFGSALREHSEWQPMLERIASTLEANPDHRAQIAKLIRELRF